MLILTRRAGESLMIGEEITVTVLGIKGNQVRIDKQPFTERMSSAKKRSHPGSASHIHILSSETKLCLRLGSAAKMI